MSDHIRADGISHSYGDHRVLTDVSLTISREARLGLIGENGAGKSTLLRVLAGAEEPDLGVVIRPARTGFLWQEVQHDPHDTVGHMIECALEEVRTIEKELTDTAAAMAAAAGGSETEADQYERALAAAERADVWTVEARRDETLDGTGVGLSHSQATIEYSSTVWRPSLWTSTL